MAATFVDARSIGGNTGGGSSVVVTRPNVADDDIVYLIVSWSNTTSANVTGVPSGFTQIVPRSSETNLSLQIWRKVITDAANEPASYTVTFGAGSFGKAVMAVSARGGDLTNFERYDVATDIQGDEYQGGSGEENPPVTSRAVVADD